MSSKKNKVLSTNPLADTKPLVETEAVVEETEAVLGETKAVLGETKAVLGETEAVVEETEAVLGETEPVLEAEPVVEKTLGALVFWVVKNMPKDEVVKNVVEYIEKTSISDHCKAQHIKTIKDIFSKID